MKALLIPNLSKVHAVKCTQDIINILNNSKIECLMEEKFKHEFYNYNVVYDDINVLLEQCTYVVAIGGDGTIIHTSKLASKYDKQIVGINVGRLGFLAALEKNQLNLLSNLYTGEYGLEHRMMVNATVIRENGETVSKNALNEVVISHGSVSKMIEMDIKCDGIFVNRYRADGLICCTPTGSTAYSLSAGGPIVSPLIDSITVTPICPHSLFGRPIIFPSDANLEISLLELVDFDTKKEQAFLTVDGVEALQLKSTDKILITKSYKKVKLVNFTKRQFYEVLNEKMMNRFRG